MWNAKNANASSEMPPSRSREAGDRSGKSNVISPAVSSAFLCRSRPASLGCALRVAVVVRIFRLPVVIVTIRRVKVHRVDHNTQNSRAHSGDQITRSPNAMLSARSCANDQDNAVDFDRKNYGIGDGKHRWGVDDDEVKLSRTPLN